MSLCWVHQAPVGLGDTVEHGLEAGQHQASPGKETLQVPEGMPSRRILPFLFKKGGYIVHSPYKHSRCQLSAATILDWWFVSSKTVSKTNLLITPFEPRRGAAYLGLETFQGCLCDLPSIVPVAQPELPGLLLLWSQTVSSNCCRANRQAGKLFLAPFQIWQRTDSSLGLTLWSLSLSLISRYVWVMDWPKDTNCLMQRASARD